MYYSGVALLSILSILASEYSIRLNAKYSRHMLMPEKQTILRQCFCVMPWYKLHVVNNVSRATFLWIGCIFKVVRH